MLDRNSDPGELMLAHGVTVRVAGCNLFFSPAAGGLPGWRTRLDGARGRCDGARVKLYMFPTSPFSRKVRIVLREKGIACEEVMPAGFPGGAILEHNPLGKVPALVLDDGTDLFDSVVICEYLDAKWPSPRLLPEEPFERALVGRWEALADGIGDATVLAMSENRRAESLRDPSAIARQHGKVFAALDRAEKDLGDRPYCAGDAFTLADVALVSALGYLDFRFPGLWKGRCPRVEALIGRLHERPSVRDTAIA